SAAIQELDNNLRNNAKGFSLQPLYGTAVPEMLRGYVELFYDLNNNPSFRLIEPLMYRSKFYDRTAQSLMLSLTRGDDRPFVLSTPRLETEGFLHLQIPFDSDIVDKLFELESKAQPWSVIRNIFSFIDQKQEDLLRSFFTAERPAPYVPYAGPGARWRYFGHACILVEVAGMNILFDPVISYTYETDLPRYTYGDLPDEIDYVLITHNHQDHILFETLLQIRQKVKYIVVPKGGNGALQDPSIKLILQNTGFKNVLEMDEFGEIQTESGSITGLPFLGEHADLNISTKLAYLVRVGRHKLLFAADSCNIEPQLYKHVYDAVGPVDALFLGMECDGAPLSWLYGPLLTRKIDRGMDESRRLAGSNFDQAIDMVTRFRCKESYVYAMGQEPWLNHVMSLKYTPESRPITESNRLLQVCRERAICAERLYGEKEILLGA
ncbi:MAG TPA: MBL fold metallo-hydrolase, partial [Candidatus Angelobacter sp.]|nr:MBL fold metallo-hydrolase [Candidatus Angelobacter sp.]